MTDNLPETVRYLITHPEDRTCRDEAVKILYREREKSLSKKQLSQMKQALKDKLDIENAITFVIGEEREKSGLKIIPLSDCQSIEWTPDGIKLISESQGGNVRWKHVIRGYVKPITKYNVDGEIVFEYDLGKTKIVTTVDELSKRLRSQGKIFSQYDALNALSAVSFELKEEKNVHATFGIYSENGKAVMCEDPVPIKEEQMKSWEQVAPFINNECEPGDLKGYIKLLSYWHPYEILPNLGSAFIAPFNPILRSGGVLDPYIYLYSPETDTGKSTGASACSKSIYGIEPTSGPAIGSEYRLATMLDSICLPICVNEADKISPKQWPTLKDSAERWLADKRGTKNLGMLDYQSRANLFFTGNAMPITTKHLIKRVLIARFDSSVIRERAKKSRELDELVEKLRPIGFQVLRWYLEENASVEELFTSLRKIEKDIRSQSNHWMSAKRPEAWACVYLGLKIFENACRRSKVDWAAPTVKKFFEDVIFPIETSSWDMRRTSIDAFKSWFQNYMIRNARKNMDREGNEHILPPIAEGTLYKMDTVRINDQVGVEGYWITDPLLAVFNDEIDEILRIPSLRELATQSADVDRIPYEVILDMNAGKQAKAVKFSDGRTKRAAFISIEDEQKRCNRVTLDMPDEVTNDENVNVTNVTGGNDGYKELQGVTNDCNQSQEAKVTELQNFYHPHFARYDSSILSSEVCAELFGDREWRTDFKKLNQRGYIEILTEDRFKWIGVSHDS